MDEKITVFKSEYDEVCKKAFGFNCFCKLMEEADPDACEYTMLSLYDLYVRHLKHELDLRKEEK